MDPAFMFPFTKWEGVVQRKKEKGGNENNMYKMEKEHVTDCDF